MIKLTSEEKNRFCQWVAENVHGEIVPHDEGNTDALVYNLVHLISGDNRLYDYQPDQIDELEALA